MVVNKTNKSDPSQTGEKLEFLEKEADVKNICKSIKLDQFKKFSKKEAKGLGLLFNALKEKSKDSHSPHSNASYSSILAYDIAKHFHLHAGANLDPEDPEHLSDPYHRRCAEKQASLSAKSYDLKNEHLDLIFLYREPEDEREHDPEMLVPCSDCARNYLLDLVKNQGKLVILLPDDKPRAFLEENNPINNDNSVTTMDSPSGKVYYRIINTDELPYLKIEGSLGGKVINSNSHCDVVTLNSLNLD